MILVTDLDGTVANTEHREHYVTGKRKDWAKFNAACIKDEPVPHAVALVRALSHYLDVVYLTGRSESCRDLTKEWIKLNGLPRGRLIMRDSTDFRRAVDFKKYTLQCELDTKKIQLVLDDDLEVRAMCEGLGIRTLAMPHNGKKRVGVGDDDR